jgi:hypothetical protein
MLHPSAQIGMDAVHGIGKKSARDEAWFFRMLRKLPAPLDDLKSWSHDPR